MVNGVGCRRMWKLVNPSVRMNIPAGHLHLPLHPLCLRHTSGLLTAHTHWCSKKITEQSHVTDQQYGYNQHLSAALDQQLLSDSSKITRDLSLLHSRDCSLKKPLKTNITLRKTDALEQKVLIELIQPYAMSWRLWCDVMGYFL